jgi:hypothetical protein
VCGCTFLEARDTAHDVIEAARQTGHSRFPVIGKSPDDILGAVHVKRAVGVEPGRRRNVRLIDILDPVTTVPDSIELDPLLLLLREQGMQMAVVVDEYGGTDGHRHPGGSHRGDRGRHRRRARSPVLAQPAPSRRHVVAVGAAASRRGRGADRHRAARGRGLRDDRGTHQPRARRIAVRGDVVRLTLDPVLDESDEELEPVTVVLTVERMEGRRIDRVSMTVDAHDPSEAGVSHE